MTDSAPVLSIVITARNDGYGGDFRERVAAPARFNCERLTEHGVAFEIVLIEWDPIEGRPLLSQLLPPYLPDSSRAALKRYVVAPEYQHALTQNPQAGYLEYLAKNVGIRRAAAPFVLVSNADILLGREVVSAIAERQLQQGTVYRAPRYDIKIGIDPAGLRWDALEDPANQGRRPTLDPPLFAGAAGDFILADRETLHALRGFNEVYRAARSGIDLNFLVKAHGAGVPIEQLSGPVYHLNHVGSMRISKVLHQQDRSQSPWGDLDWPSRSVTYNNPESWGLRDAPTRERPDGVVVLEFSWDAVPPLVDLHRVVLPAKREPATT